MAADCDGVVVASGAVAVVIVVPVHCQGISGAALEQTQQNFSGAAPEWAQQDILGAAPEQVQQDISVEHRTH